LLSFAEAASFCSKNYGIGANHATSQSSAIAASNYAKLTPPGTGGYMENFWWLRSQGYFTSKPGFMAACSVGSHGMVGSGMDDVAYDSTVIADYPWIRPALWVNSEIFAARVNVVHKNSVNGTILEQTYYALYPSSGSSVSYGPYNPKSFSGYGLGVLASGSAPASGAVNVGQNITITYLYSPLYSVSVSGSYATPTGAGSYLPGTSVTVDAGSRAGYTFSGWTVSGIGSLPNTVLATFTMPSNNVQVTANWDVDSGQTHSVSYNVDYYIEGVFKETQTVTKTVWAGAVELSVDALNVSRYVGYKVGSTVPAVWPSMTAGGSTLEAYYVVDESVWDASYVVHYYLRGTTISVAMNKVVTGQLVGSVVTEFAISVAGYTVVEPASKDLTLAVSGNELFFYYDAIVLPVVYHYLTYYSDVLTGGSVPLGGAFVNGATVTVTDVGDMVLDGFVFLGWDTSYDAVEVVYQAGDSLTLFGDVDLYAVWQQKVDLTTLYTVHYYLVGTTNSVFADKVEVGVVGASVSESAVVVAGYVAVVPTSLTGVLNATDNVFVFCYKPNVEYVVHYYLQDTTTNVTDSKVVSGQTLGSTVTENNVAVTGYSGVAPTSLTGTLNATDDVFIFYYTANSVVDPPPSSGDGGSGNSGGSGSSSGSGGSSKSSPTPSTTHPPALTPEPREFNPIEEPVLTWALLNLILGVIGVILVVVLVVFVLMWRNKRQKTEQKRSVGSEGNKGQQYAVKQGTTSAENQKQKQHRTLLFLTAVILGIVGIVVFFLTEDMSRVMGWVDKWTIVNAIIFIVEIIAIVFTFKSKKESDKKEGKMPN
jgi:uncharacterized repeat protein (TIGR02543 family)